VLFSGDGDFRYLIDAIQRKGRKVTVISTSATQPSMVADELRRQADHFIDLTSLTNEISRPITNRNDESEQSAAADDEDYDDDYDEFEEDSEFAET
ncbi:MAG: NYN domain-containing protein, partial [Fimbriimonadaceae bacterium]|nr:NYN domain-containing protein [Alphaproteobacteria bacterium]